MTHEIPGSLPFTTGDSTSGGTIVYRLEFIPEMWMLEAIMAALVLMTTADNWNEVGLVSPEDAASLCIKMVEGFVPMPSGPGFIYPYAGVGLPANTLWCDGSSYLRSDYPELFAVIGSTYGSVDADHFSVPNLSYRVPIGIGTWSGQPEITLGDNVGEPEHTLSTGEMPSHQHSVDGFVPALVVAPGEVAVESAVTTPSGTGYTGGGDPHNNMQPSLGLNYVISTV